MRRPLKVGVFRFLVKPDSAAWDAALAKVALQRSPLPRSAATIDLDAVDAVWRFAVWRSDEGGPPFDIFGVLLSSGSVLLLPCPSIGSQPEEIEELAR